MVLSHRFRDLSFPAIGSDGTVYVGSNDDNLYAFPGPDHAQPRSTPAWAQSTLATNAGFISGLTKHPPLQPDLRDRRLHLPLRHVLLQHHQPCPGSDCHYYHHHPHPHTHGIQDLQMPERQPDRFLSLFHPARYQYLRPDP